MDLKEFTITHAKKHPWEVARLKALHKILAPVMFEGITALDVGCGDGFISGNIFNSLTSKEVTAVDINLTDELICELNNRSSGMKYCREMPEKGAYDLILLLDVIEHVEADRKFLTDIVDRYAPRDGKVMITVPAFQSLFGRHDVFLGHYRRYNLKELVALTTRCGLKVLSSGYLFSTLLLPKLVLYKLLNIGKESDGVGNWDRGEVITRVIEMVFDSDNSLLISASRLGIKIPGLTGWVLCEKRG
ncbi:class I SAM-dependent methyltransferase [Oryzomonas rubra]|uniref:Methyltransferase domain-containing protein n=1 Tax=Oryzomonas rubra TaxID=2509454 RepID=A0A5A9XDZ6_9BACT|nr:methyltransferase domain-containing protein [Oryzomonas rubra]KAA0890469.1 methyltransferase domain-containing protein [Oryzomonas rubra]